MNTATKVDLTAVLRPILGPTVDLLINCKVSLLHFRDDIVSILAETESRPNGGHIIAVSTLSEPPNGRRVLGVVALESISKVFARHTAQYLYYGTHTGIGNDGHHKWEIAGISFDKSKFPLPLLGHPLLFEDFHGTDIGSTVAFEIHNDHFCAVSNQGTFEVEEVDWTSFYHCVRFPLNNPVRAAMEKNERVYRRQHAQGPIHDSWTDLSLQTSEKTNEMVIVESRREWEQASSRQSRTFYVSKFDVDQKHPSWTSSSFNEASEKFMLPENDIFVDLLDSSNKPNYMPTPPQYSWSQHPEFSKTDPSPRSFILAKTKFRAYNYSCSSFLDLVEDDKCCIDPSKPPCLRLRVGSRTETEPSHPWTTPKGKARLSPTKPIFQDKHTRYHHSPVVMWPPPAHKCPCSKRLHDILNPPLPPGASYARSVTGVLDSRSLVYMVKPGRSYGSNEDNTAGTVVVIDFTRPWKPAAAAAVPTTAALSTASLPMARADSKMADADLNDRCWRWSPGLRKRCREQTCR